MKLAKLAEFFLKKLFGGSKYRLKKLHFFQYLKYGWSQYSTIKILGQILLDLNERNAPEYLLSFVNHSD